MNAIKDLLNFVYENENNIPDLIYIELLRKINIMLNEYKEEYNNFIKILNLQNKNIRNLIKNDESLKDNVNV